MNEKKQEKANSTFEKDRDSIMSSSQVLQYKKGLFFTIMICFIVCIVLVCERVFRTKIDQLEIDLLESIQPKLVIPFNLNENFKTFYFVIGVIGDFKFYCLIMAHLFISVYVSVDAIIGLKCLFVHCISFYILTILELIYQGPRPFWMCEHLITFYCDNSFTNPSVLTFGFFFDGSYLLTLYLRKKKEIQLLEDLKLEDDTAENHDKITFFLKIVVFGGLLCAHIIVFLRYSIGLLFISDYFMALIYFVICYLLVKYLDYHIDQTIKSSTILKKKARQLVFSWIIFLILGILFAYVIFLVSQSTMEVAWIKNYVNLYIFLFLSCKDELRSQ